MYNTLLIDAALSSLIGKQVEYRYPRRGEESSGTMTGSLRGYSLNIREGDIILEITDRSLVTSRVMLNPNRLAEVIRSNTLVCLCFDDWEQVDIRLSSDEDHASKASHYEGGTR